MGRQISLQAHASEKSKIDINKQKGYIVIKHIAQSLIPIEEIKLLLESKDLDILCISETWLQPNIAENLMSITNYNIFTNDNPLNPPLSVTRVYMSRISLPAVHKPRHHSISGKNVTNIL